MTPGHKHRTLAVQDGRRLVRFLRRPRWSTRDARRVNRSPYPYGVNPSTNHLVDETYYLSILGVLHRWTGLTLEVGPRHDGWLARWYDRQSVETLVLLGWAVTIMLLLLVVVL